MCARDPLFNDTSMYHYEKALKLVSLYRGSTVLVTPKDCKSKTSVLETEELASEDLERYGALLSLLEDMFSRLRVQSLKVDQMSERLFLKSNTGNKENLKFH
jgi:hypothetical protein